MLTGTASARRLSARGDPGKPWSEATTSARGQLAESNAQQVRAVRKVIEGLGLDVATPDDAREKLQLKGKDRVAF